MLPTVARFARHACSGKKMLTGQRMTSKNIILVKRTKFRAHNLCVPALGWVLFKIDENQGAKYCTDETAESVQASARLASHGQRQ